MSLILPHRGRLSVGAHPLVLTFRGHVDDGNYGTSTRTYSGVSIGTAPTGSRRRWVIACWSWTGPAATRTLNTITINGNTMDTYNSGALWPTNSSNAQMVTARYELNTGTTCELIATLSGNRNGWVLDVYTLESGPAGWGFVSGSTYTPSEIGGSTTPSITGMQTGDCALLHAVDRDGKITNTSYDQFTTIPSGWGEAAVRGINWDEGVHGTTFSETLFNQGGAVNAAYSIAGFRPL